MVCGGLAVDVRGWRGGGGDVAGAGRGAGTMLPVRDWIRRSLPCSADSQAARDAEIIWKRSGNSATPHPVDVIRTIDGDTFEARVHLEPGLDLNTRVRLRGIDAPELKASC